MKKAIAATLDIGLLIFAISAFGQAKAAKYYSSAELKQDFDKLAAQAKAKNIASSGADLDASGNGALKLSYRRETGGAEVHPHFDDVMVVEGGSATIVTGGSLVEPKTEGNGERKGKSIEGGTSRVLAPGDIIHIPAGTPHQLLLNRGPDFRAFVVKVHE
jgi:mannose-6-phosphate isomerase-like protein (cupin superfamily)